MELTGYLDFWFTDLPIVERVEKTNVTLWFEALNTFHIHPTAREQWSRYAAGFRHLRMHAVQVYGADAYSTHSGYSTGGVFIHTHDQAADVVRRINHPRLKLAFDCYHQQRTAGNLIYGLEAYHGLYPTVHIGDVPTRQEPGSGEINFPNIAPQTA